MLGSFKDLCPWVSKHYDLEFLHLYSSHPKWQPYEIFIKYIQSKLWKHK